MRRPGRAVGGALKRGDETTAQREKLFCRAHAQLARLATGTWWLRNGYATVAGSAGGGG